MKKSSSTLVNGGLVPEEIGFEFFLKNRKKTGKKSVIASKKLVYRYPDSIYLTSYVPKGLTNSLSYCGSFKDEYMYRYGYGSLRKHRLPVPVLVCTGIILGN